MVLTTSAGSTSGEGTVTSIPPRLFYDFTLNRVSAGALKTYELLARWKERGEHGGWPTQSHLAAALNTTRRSVSRYLGELAAHGYIRRIHHVPKNKVQYMLLGGAAVSKKPV